MGRAAKQLIIKVKWSNMDPEKVKKVKPQEIVAETLKMQTSFSVQMSIDAAYCLGRQTGIEDTIEQLRTGCLN